MPYRRMPLSQLAALSASAIVFPVIVTAQRICQAFIERRQAMLERIPRCEQRLSNLEQATREGRTRYRKRTLNVLISAFLVMALVSCAGNQEQAVRHLVLAELIQREDLSENQIQIQAVHFVSGREAIVDAKVLGHGGRFDGWHKLRCTVERDSGRWSIMQVSQE